MFIDVIKNHGKPYLRLVHSVREPDKNGKMVSTRKVLLNIGPLDKYDDGEPDYVERLRRSFREGHPIIDELEPYCSMKPPKRQYSFKIEEGSSDCVGKTYNFATVLLDRILTSYGIKKFIYKEFDPKVRGLVYDYVSLLVYKQILSPANNITDFCNDSDLWTPNIKKFHTERVYQVLEYIYKLQEKFINCIEDLRFSASCFDVLTYHYKTMDPNEDISYSIDENGSGHYEHTSHVALFMDDECVPVSIKRFPDSNSSNIEAQSSDEFTALFDQCILVGDYSTYGYKKILNAKRYGCKYIVSKSLFYSSEVDRQWAYEEWGYEKIGETFKYRSNEVTRVYTDEDSRHVYYTESMIVLWSKKLEERVAAEYKDTLEFIDKLEESSENFHVKELEKESVRRFIDRKYMDQLNGDVNSEQLRSMIDIPKVRAYLKHPGYFQIVTSETSANPLDIIERYYAVKQSEDQFRSMERTSGKDCFDLCSTAYDQAYQIIDLIACAVTGEIRSWILDYKRYEKGSPSKPDLFNEMPIERIRDALNKWQVEELPGGLYRFLNLDDPDLQEILDACYISISKNLYTKKGINQIMRRISPQILDD